MPESAIRNRAAVRLPPITGAEPGCPKQYVVTGSLAVEVPRAVHGLTYLIQSDADVIYGFQILLAGATPQVLTTAGVSTWAAPNANCGGPVTKDSPAIVHLPTVDRGYRLWLLAHAPSASLRLSSLDPSASGVVPAALGTPGGGSGLDYDMDLASTASINTYDMGLASTPNTFLHDMGYASS